MMAIMGRPPLYDDTLFIQCEKSWKARLKRWAKRASMKDGDVVRLAVERLLEEDPKAFKEPKK